MVALEDGRAPWPHIDVSVLGTTEHVSITPLGGVAACLCDTMQILRKRRRRSEAAYALPSRAEARRTRSRSNPPEWRTKGPTATRACTRRVGRVQERVDGDVNGGARVARAGGGERMSYPCLNSPFAYLPIHVFRAPPPLPTSSRTSTVFSHILPS